MRPLIYDLSRLSTRVLQATPNGIDRLDSLIADHALAGPAHAAFALLFGPNGPRLFAPGALPVPTQALARAWGEADNLAHAVEDAAPIIAALTDARGRLRHKSPRPARPLRIAQALARYGLRKGEDPRTAAPRDAVYLNVSHFPLEWSSHVAWLAARPDIRFVMAVHDLLPISHPHFFWDGEPERHRTRMRLLAERGAAAVAFSATVADALDSHMATLGRRNLPILIARPPLSALFYQPPPRAAALADANYFIVCGTIEPRKNHGLLLEVWRRLARDLGPAAPKLLVVGRRGWRCDDIVGALADKALGGAVIEASNLSTPAYRLLLAHARALLSPSWEEGFGLPLSEALATGVPVIGADIAAYREQGGGRVVYLDPGDSAAWHDSVLAFADPARPERARALAALIGYAPAPRAPFLAEIDAFLGRI